MSRKKIPEFEKFAEQGRKAQAAVDTILEAHRAKEEDRRELAKVNQIERLKILQGPGVIAQGAIESADGSTLLHVLAELERMHVFKDMLKVGLSKDQIASRLSSVRARLASLGIAAAPSTAAPKKGRARP